MIGQFLRNSPSAIWAAIVLNFWHPNEFDTAMYELVRYGEHV